MERRELAIRRRLRRLRLQVPRNIIDRNNPLELYDDLNFRDRYRFTKFNLVYICETFVGSVEDHRDKRGQPLTAIQQMALSLRFYATGSFQVNLLISQ